MSNDTAKTITTNIVPVQGTFEPLPPYECINLIGPAGTPFYAPVNPNLDGVSITNSTINSTTIGVTTPAAGAFTTASATNQPVGNNDLTTKLYVDSLALGISWKQPVVAATTANITLSGAQTIDTVPVVAGDRVLVKDQTAPAENGIYIVAAGAWSRSPDANSWDELVSALVFVESGGQAGSAWYCPIQPGGTLGVTAVTWNNFSVGGVYFAGTGLNLSGGDTFNITNTGVTAATYGSASAVPVIAVNQQGQITSASNTNIAIDAAAISSGTINTARISGDYSGITGVGTLTNLTVSNTITGSISGNAATATTATSATSATTATNLAGGATGSVPYQSGAGATTFVGIGSTGQVLTVAGGVPTWATPTTGTVTSVGTAGTVNGLTLTGGPITGSGTVTLGGTLDLSAPPTIGNTTPNTIAGTTVTASTSFASPVFKATTSAGGVLQNASGVAQAQWGAGGGSNFSIDVSANLNGANAQIDISPTGTGHVHIKPTGAGSLEIAPTVAGTINNMSIGGTTAAAAKVTTLDVTSTLALNGSTGTAGYVLTSNGASAPTWQANSNGVTITDDTTTNATRYLTFSELTTGTETTLDVSSTKLQFNPSTGAFTVSGLSNVDNLRLDGNTISSTDTNGNIVLAPNGSGRVEVSGTSSNAGGINFYEDTDNGTNKILLTAPASVASDKTITFPDLTGTVSLATYTTQVFSSGSGTYTTPAGCQAIVVKCWGGGGSGGGGNGSNARGTGGGGGGFCQKTIASPSATYSYAVGAGGAAAAQGANGTAGGNTTFGSLTANGGNGGSAASGGAIGGSGGGSASGGDLNITGASSFTLNNAAYPGWGGSSPQGGSGGQSNIAENGLAPGGGGASANYTGNSGAGAAGAILVMEFY
jgi:hypothetical protein